MKLSPFSSESFINFSSCIQVFCPFSADFCIQYMVRVQLHFLHMDVWFFQHHLLKRLSFLPLNDLGALVEVCERKALFLGLVLLHWSMCLSLHEFHTVLISVALQFEIKKCEISKFLFPKGCFGYSEFLKMPYEFQDEFLICKKPLGF